MPRYDPQHPRRVRLLLWLLFVKRGRLLRGALTILLAIAAVTTVLMGFFALLEPWNHSLFLWPTLTGGWYGEFSTPEGRRHLVHLDIGGDSENPPIDGTATTCDDRGIVREFSLSGWPRGWRGRTFRLNTGGEGEKDGAGVRLARIDGAWERDTMRVTATLDYFKRVNGASVSSSADPHPEPVVGLTLRRAPAQEFSAACGRIRRAP
jgi:hypothetical protein